MLSLVKDIARSIVGNEDPDLPEEDIDIELTNVHFELEMPLVRWTWKAQRKMFDAETEAGQNPRSAECAEKLSDYHMARCRRFRIAGRWNELPGEPMLDSEAAITEIRAAIGLTPKESNSELIRRFSKYAILREYRFARTGDVEDLDDAIAVAITVVDDTPEGHPALPHRYTNLGNMLASMFERKGYMQDIDLAIESAENALKASEKMNIEERDYLKGRLIRNVAVKLEMRDQRLSNMNDLKKAISMMETAIQSMNQDHPDRAFFRSELGNMRASNFRRTKNIRDLNDAIEIIESALQELPKNHPSKRHLQYNLGNRYLDRFRQLRNKEDLEKSFNISYKASSTTPLKDPDAGKHWCSLASKYIIRAQESQKLTHMAQAMGFASRGPGKLPESDPMEAEALECLGDAFMMKHDYVGRPEYFAEAVGKYIEASQAENAPPLTIIRIHKKLAEIAWKEGNWKEAAQVYTRAVTLWERALSPRTLSRDDMEFVIRYLSGLGSMAAVCILNDGQPASNALIASESGRGMMAGLIINLRSDVPDLKDKYPDLYEQYKALQDAVSSSTLVDDEPGQLAEEFAVSTTYQKNQQIRKMDQLAEEIRSKEGLAHFQQPLSYYELVHLAKFGPIVCFNITSHRCDAFLVTRRGIQCLRLPDQYHKIQIFVDELVRKKSITGPGPQSEASNRNQRLREILADLWKLAVRPVLACLGLLLKVPPTKLPRIWWVTSGLMGLLPLHAAGSGWGTSRNNTASHVVSSYVPTFRALAYARARQEKHKSLLEPGHECIIVSMPETNGKNKLAVAKEVKAVKEHLEAQANTVSYLEIPSEKEVCEKLQAVSIAHFACHGESVASNPSSSGLLLNGGRLTVRKLAAMSLDQAQIVYLSACSTAENSADDELVDETIHIASAFQLVGFPHVIGTLWPASNKIAEVVAPKFYASLGKHLHAGESNNDAVAYALDEAVRNLWKGKKTENVIQWCPFIHIGA